jgi:hypothetical protein
MRPLKVEISTQVIDFVARQAPESRKKLRRGLRALAREKGEIRALEGRLAGWCRLRVGALRIIFRYVPIPGGRLIRCDFAERRALVYEMFERMARHLK